MTALKLCLDRLAAPLRARPSAPNGGGGPQSPGLRHGWFTVRIRPERRRATGSSWMNRAILVSAALTVALGVAASPAPAAAKGCLKGALVGGVAGHYAGHH